ncbi:uncharacterized protein KIAA1614 homolog isoform X2 [Rhineura floridana]|uniref:uncharacterized protein KIAA1614 homolog isoform X2 n=1 Tax=Rhineura floridana TaxID=261503 RepID=UPI002AC7FE77|nr:uncharacterized protein KIAA1614 homolog isoform X2 [Rhineura floridana]
MEGSFTTGRRRALNNVKQCVRNIPRTKQPPGSPENTNDHCVSGPAWVQVGLLGDMSKGISSVLESKVKALKEKRDAINRQAEAAPQEWASPKKVKTRKGKPLTEPVPQDAVVEPQAQICTYVTDVLLDSTDYPHLKQDECQGLVLARLYIDDFEPLKGPKAVEERTSISWSSPEEFQTHPGRNVLDEKGSSGNAAKRASQNNLCGASSLKDLPFNQDANGREEHLVQAKDFESSSFLHEDDPCGVLTAGCLWRAESWDSLCSGRSNASTLSLAERVERNRSMLQEMLNASQVNCHSSRDLHTLLHHKKEAPGLGNDAPSNEILANDVDWDSGVSLQDSEGFRAFVPNQELELSPRHEQAKQLLQKARMKARTNPLRASHNILPTAPPERRDGCGISAADAESFALKDGDSHTSGNLSDSSSGESNCDHQRKRGPSPSRVRFEDESARDAEVRYLERLQQRQKRVLDSVLLSLGRSPLVSKPDLSDYINGELHPKENSTSKPGWEQQSTGQAAGVLAHQSGRGRSEKRKPLAVNEEGKSSACGSYVKNLSASQNPDTGVNQPGNGMGQILQNIPPKSKELRQANENKEINASQEDSQTRTLGPKGTPLWILPSRQRVCTERIRETYTGEMSCIDDVDSALDSTTDTSDSYRTDSEEAGISNQQPVVKSHWHSGPGPDLYPFCPSQKGTKNRKAAGERHGASGSGSARGGELWDNVPSLSKGEIRSSANEEDNCFFKGASAVGDQVIKMAASKAEVFPGSSQPIDLNQLEKKGRMQEHTKVSKAPLRQPIPTVHSQPVPSHLVPDDVTDSVSGKPVETRNCNHKPTNHLNQTRQVKGPSQQLTEQMAANHSLVNQVPVPPATGKAHSSPVPYRRAVLTGCHKLTNQDPRWMEQANELSIYSPSPNSFRHVCVSGLKEQNGLQNPKVLSKSQLLVLSTNNCNNTHAKHQPKTLVTATVKSREEEQCQDSQKLGKNQGPSSLACGVPPATPSAISSTAMSLSLTTEEANFTTSAQSISREASAAEVQKAEPEQASKAQQLVLRTLRTSKELQAFSSGWTGLGQNEGRTISWLQWKTVSGMKGQIWTQHN